MIDVAARTFTRAEAQSLVPVLNKLFSEARAIVEELLARRHDVVAVDASGAAIVDEESAFRMDQLRTLLQARLRIVDALGVEVRRVDGLVDIPAWIDGEQGYFCWQYGESEVSRWHRATEDCSDRRALDPDLSIGLH